jgi:hypothetical protein
MLDKSVISKFLNPYKFEIETPGSRKIYELKPLVTHSMKYILQYENDPSAENIEKALDQILTESILTKDFNIDDLYLQDRFYLTMMLRMKTKGEEFTWNWDCPSCKNPNITTIDLLSLPVKALDSTIEKKVKIHDSLTLLVDFITRGDQKEVFKYIKQVIDNNEKMTPSEKDYDKAMATAAAYIKGIETPEGIITELTLEDKLYILKEIPDSSANLILKWKNDNEFGMDVKYTINCRNKIAGTCEYSVQEDIPLERFFFS